MAGVVSLNLRGRTLLLKKASREQNYLAQQVYIDHLREAELEGLFTEEQLLEWMYESECWSDDQQDLLDKLPKEIEEFKVALFKAVFKTDERKTIRLALNAAKRRLEETQEKRHGWNHISCSGAASLARSRFLVGCSLFGTDGEAIFDYRTFWQESGEILEQAMAAFAAERIGEAAYRELARTDPWRSVWSTRKCEASLFGIPAADYTEEQRALVGWSQLYDSIYEHPRRPTDGVIEDDDLLDGWLILQKREQNKQLTQSAGDELLSNEKIKNSQEVFFVANTIADAKEIEQFNDASASATKKRRLKHLAKHGTVDEADMPDSQQKIRQEHARQFMATAKGTPT